VQHRDVAEKTQFGAAEDFLKTIRTRWLYFTRVDVIIISACSAIELINAADPLDREVYANGTREGNAFSRLPRSLVGLLVRCTPCCAEQRRIRKIWRKIGRGREGGRESGGTAR